MLNVLVAMSIMKGVKNYKSNGLNPLNIAIKRQYETFARFGG